MESPYLHFTGISKTFLNPDGVPYPVIENFDLRIKKEEFISIIDVVVSVTAFCCCWTSEEAFVIVCLSFAVISLTALIFSQTW